MGEGIIDKRVRKKPADRAADIVAAADRWITAERTAAIAMKDIGDAMGASRALVYAYFPDQFGLLDAVLDRHIAMLLDAGIDRALAKGKLINRAQAAGLIYMDHIAAHGAALEIILREQAIARQLKGGATRVRGQLYRRLANVARSELKLPAKEALALVQLLIVIPEEAGAMIANGTLSRDEAIELHNRLIASSIDVLRPNR